MNIDEHLKVAKKLTILLDTKFNFLGIKFGLDPLLTLIPGLGSIIGGFVSFYTIWIAIQLKVPATTYLKMAWNILIDMLFGGIPLVGIVLDVFYKSNVRNLKLLEMFIKPKVVDAEIVE